MNDSAINHRVSRPLLDGAALDAAIDEARAALAVLALGRLSYDRYTDPWPGAEPPDPDDLDAACDLLLRGACYGVAMRDPEGNEFDIN
ncbi:MAG TPA: hypothetical protein VNO54_29830 [Streptosporangiaceae bacterium]|nr:hypothetical protein [Streptosporangiaceae bacterium]